MTDDRAESLPQRWYYHRFVPCCPQGDDYESSPCPGASTHFFAVRRLGDTTSLTGFADFFCDRIDISRWHCFEVIIIIMGFAQKDLKVNGRIDNKLLDSKRRDRMDVSLCQSLDRTREASPRSGPTPKLEESFLCNTHTHNDGVPRV
jgi:hypothetical protein